MATPEFITDKHYEGIGRVVVAWSRIETAMIVALQALLDTHKAKAIITFWHMGYNDRRDRITALCDITTLDGREKKELATLISRLDAGYYIRNLAAHFYLAKRLSAQFHQTDRHQGKRRTSQTFGI